MRKLTNIIKEAKQRLEIQDDSINFIDSIELKKYLDIANKFLSNEAKAVVQWLIDNNSNYIQKFGGDNALATFYNGQQPKDPELKELWSNINKVVKDNRILEIPVFQTPEQFYAILNKEISPDEILLDLNSEKGRTEVAKKYDKLVWKIARSFVGKSTLTLDDLYSSGLEGLVNAMNNYGKKKKFDTEDIDGETEKVKSYTFMSYAAFCIRFQILSDIRNTSHLVRIAASAQQKEKAETGRNTKNNAISGDKVVGSDDNGDKTLFDYMSIGGGDSGDAAINSNDINKIWQDIFTELEKKFSKKTMDIWYSFNELNGYEKIKNKDLAKKYNTVPSGITYNLYLVNTYIMNTPKIKNMFMDLKELIGESHSIKDDHQHILNR
jgi:hypothetical protein